MRPQHYFFCLSLSSVSCGVPTRESARRAPPVQPAVSQQALPPVAARAANDGGTGIAALPAVARGARIAGWSPKRFSKPEHARDGDRSTAWGAGAPTKERPAWLAIDVGRAPSALLVSWSASGSFDYDETDFGSPGAYRIDTSPDSTDGEDGAWTTVVDVPSVSTHGAAHALDFRGKRWVKLVVTAAPAKSPNGVQIDEVDVRDASLGTDDTWFFMGDSITAFAFGRTVPVGLGFADLIRKRHPDHHPSVLNGGIGGDKSDEGLRRLDAWLALNPSARYWGIAYGTNDAAGSSVDSARFEQNLTSMVVRVKAAGRVPVLATIPHASDGAHAGIPAFNRAIDLIRREHQLPAGPDLYAWFLAHPEELRDGLHPNDKGIASINRLWADAVDRLYLP